MPDIKISGIPQNLALALTSLLETERADGESSKNTFQEVSNLLGIEYRNSANNFGDDTGVANDYAFSVSPALTSYQKGQIFTFKAVNANTTASLVEIDGLGSKVIKDRAGNNLVAGAIPAGSMNIIQYDGINFQLLVNISEVSPIVLVDGANISFDFKNKYFDFRQLETAQAAITLTVSNVIQGANQIISIKKTIGGDVTITLAGATFYGYNDSDLNTTPQIVLSGAINDIFDISFLARTDTEIGVAIGLNGN